MKIPQGRLKPLRSSASGLPDQSNALMRLFYPIKAVTVQKQQIDGFTKEIKTSQETQGVIQPLKAQEIAMKPEGLRTWIWMNLHCLPDLILNLDDIVSIDGQEYRVMAVYPYQQYGFRHYELGQNYEDLNP